MKTTLSPKELAEAVGVSESSLKRWADSGRVRVTRTAGGHRRITIADAVNFIRDARLQVLNPALLGLTATPILPDAIQNEDDTTRRLYTHLTDGQAAEARGLIFSLYLGGRPIAEIVDGPMRKALEEIGAIWTGDRSGIMIEHRASEICVDILRQLKATLPANVDGPVAVGAAPERDTAVIPSLAAATVLHAEGYRATNLGPDTPIDTLGLAARSDNAGLVWLSITHRRLDGDLLNNVQALLMDLRQRGARLAIGAGDPGLLPGNLPDDVLVGRSLAELVAFVRGLRKPEGQRPGSADRSA